jgi:hypothetical protein
MGAPFAGPEIVLVHEPASFWVRIANRVGLRRLMPRLIPARRWKIELRNFRALQEVLGKDVLNAFSRCFVHADRLTSTISCIHASQRLYGRAAVAFERDLNTMVWFTIGTLREFGRAVNDLRNALRRQGRLDPNSAPWQTLRALEDRWNRNEFYRKKRDTAAFHVDPEVVNRGIDEITRDQADTVLSLGDGRRGIESQIALGLLTLHNGIGLDLEGYREFLQTVSDDHGDAATAIQEAFIQDARAAGIPMGRD